MDAVGVGLLLLDGDGMVVAANGEAARTFGYAAAGLAGKPVGVLMPPAPRGAEQPERDPARPAMRTIEGRGRAGLRKDGSPLVLDVALTPLPTIGGGRVLATVVDATERAGVEALLTRLNAGLAEKNAELERLMYTVSHELKSPLVTIQGYSGLLAQALASDRPEHAREHVQRIGEAVDKMRGTIGDLLELSRAGRSADSLTRIQTGDLVAEVLRDLEVQLVEAGAQVQVADDLPAVWCEHVRLKQVFQNLLSNAIKYGRPTAGVPRIGVGATRGPGDVTFFVSDNGPGIEPEFHEKAFALFQRLSSAQEGSGVGLALVRRIAEAFGGRAWIRSTPGQGAAVHVSIPDPPPAGSPLSPGAGA